MRQPVSPPLPAPNAAGSIEPVPFCVDAAVPRLQKTLHRAFVFLGRSGLCAVPGLSSHGSERMDRQDLYQSALPGGFENFVRSAQVAVRVLPPQLRQLSQTKRSIYLQALEEVWSAGGRSSDGGRRLAEGSRARRRLGAGQDLTQKRPGFTARLSEPPACSAFVPQPEAPVGAGIPERPFTRPQRRFRHHCGVNVPGLPLQFHVRDASRTRSIESSPPDSVSKPKPGEFVTFNPLPAPISDDLARSSDLHSPSGYLNPPDPSVRPASSREARPARRPICFSLPVARFFRLALRIDTRNFASPCPAIVP